MADRENNAVDSRVFWVTNYVTPLLWIIFGLVAVLSLSINNGTICIVCLMMTSTQLYAYIRCQRDHKKQMQGYLFKQASKRMSKKQMAKLAAAGMKQAATAAQNQEPKVMG
mmetsp:Transcript_85304/g.117744  ORF Transcript_85304/g.117744 Transcript_85304/m.117744 type:complete len:111 (+) Transcript_85304:509-841(+)